MATLSHRPLGQDRTRQFSKLCIPVNIGGETLNCSTLRDGILPNISKVVSCRHFFSRLDIALNKLLVLSSFL